MPAFIWQPRTPSNIFPAPIPLITIATRSKPSKCSSRCWISILPKQQQIHSLKGIASLYFQQKKFDQAQQYYKQIAELDPNDPETYYSLAVIDWMEAYQPDQKARAELGMKPTDELKDKKACSALKEANAQKVEDGIQNLQKALQLRPDYDDAMAYLNLLYRQRAEYECDDAGCSQGRPQDCR